MKKNYKIKSCLGVLLGVLLFSCDDFVKIDPPRTALVKETVFDSDATAEAAMIDIYYQLMLRGFASGGPESLTFLLSISSDEQDNYYKPGPGSYDAELQQFNDNSLKAQNSAVLSIWSNLYKTLYKANSVIEGVATSKGVTGKMRDQLTGEAKFIRGFCHFYLVNLWGDVPLVLTTDYRVNSSMSRVPAHEVYQQIIQDLTDAQALLPPDYSVSNNERVRVNKSVATAMLARVYLYNQEWAKAESQATQLIEDSKFILVDNLTAAMLNTSTEVIWQLWSNYYPNEIFTFYVFSTPNVGALRQQFIDQFEPGDQRLTLWTATSTPDAVTYYFSFKYNNFVPAAEYSTVFRLAEQYLIRAEARAQQNNFDGAQEDINIIRHRAGLGDTPANDQTSLLLAIEQEKKFELFNEWGHRWFDLKRTGRADAVLGPIKPQWSSTAVLLPIPLSETINNPGLKGAQNPGY